MKSKKFKFLTAFLLVFSLVLSACGSNDNNENSQGDNGDSNAKDKEVTIVYARGKDQTKGTEKMVEAFEKKYPNIHVERREMPNDSNKQHDSYVTMLNAQSDEIDVFDIDVVWPAEFAQAGYTLPLDRFIQKDNVDLSAYNQGALSAAQFNGKTWALPKFIDAGLLYYRKDIVKNPPKTWDELIADAEKYKGEKGTKFGFALQAKQYEGIVCNALEFVNAYGGEFIDKNGNVVVNSPETIKGLKEMKKIVTSDFVPNNVTTFSEPETMNAFIQGQAVFARNWPYMWASSQDKDQSKIAGKVGVAPLPAGDDGSASALGGWMAAINKYSKHKEAAWKFLKFMAGPEGQKIDAIYGGHAPSITSLYDDQEVLEANPFFKEKGFQDALDNATSRPVTPNYQKISEIIQINVSKVMTGDETAEQAAKVMETKMKAATK